MIVICYYWMKLTLELRRSHVISFITCLENKLYLVIMFVPVFLSLSSVFTLFFVLAFGWG